MAGNYATKPEEYFVYLKTNIMKTWSFIQNPFLVATENSYINAIRISSYHNSALAANKSEPFIQALAASFKPLHTNLTRIHATCLSQESKQQAETLNVKQFMKLLAGTKIQEWDIIIQSRYKQNTPAYKELLPNRRLPFQRGRQIQRLSAVKALTSAIGSDESLSVVKADIDNFYEEFDRAYNNKLKEATNRRAHSDLEAARIVMCDAQYANLGALMQKYSSTPQVIAQYFDLQAIRRSSQTLFTGHIKAGEVHFIAKRTFKDTDKIKLFNAGTTQLKFYLARAKDRQPDAVFLSLDAGEQTVLASELGNLDNKYLMVLNTDVLYTGAFSVELI